VAFEALAAIPLFLIVLLGGVGIADLLITEQLVSEASGRAARKAAMGGSTEEIDAVVRAVLGDKRAGQATITVRGVDGTEASQVPPGGLLEVRIEIAARHALTTGLAPVGADEPLLGRTVMQRE